MSGNRLTKPTILGVESELVEAGTALVLGMTWEVILGNNLEVSASKVALAAKASHFTHCDNVGSVGFTSLKAAAKTVYVSAANVVAQQHPTGDYLIALEINEDETWVCGVSNGTVVSGFDQVVSDQLEINNITSSFRTRFVNAKLHGDIENGFVDNYSWATLSEGARIGDTRKQSIVRKTTKAMSEHFSSVPRPLLYMLALVFIVVFGQRFALPTIKQYMARSSQKPTVPPTVAWSQAIESWRLARPVSVGGSLNGLLENLADQPLLIAGWRQSGTDCIWGQKAWVCTSRYGSDNRAETNSAFVKAMPKDWTATFMLLDDIVVKFSVPTTSNLLTLAELKPTTDYELLTGSEIQQVTPLLPATSSPMTKFGPVQISEPKTAEGKAIPMPAEIVLPKVSTLSIAGPMRNIAAYQPWVDDVAWTSVNLKIDLGKEPAAKHSIVNMELKGNIYAKN